MSSFQLQNSEVLARLKPFGILFEKSLSDLIKGIRSHSKESPESLLSFLDSAILECKNELNTTDLETKAMSILKLTYLEMYGFDMSWCNFQILEVMSSTKFQQKRIGYLAAIQSFKNEQDLLILATNQFKKDLNSHNHIEIGLALSGIATIVTPNLSKDINDDVLMKLNHSKPYIRKKAILAMYKIFLQYPESLRLNFNRIIEKLDDEDVAVVSATVNVVCEISKKNPNIFISYLPKFFTILEETKNNWLSIRILKLFQSLSKVEPRMKKKILPTILNLMLDTKASSLIYECINCIINGQMLSPDSTKDRETAKICIKKLMDFFQTKDSNLKFVGLIALINILKVFPVFMHNVDGVSLVVMDCLNDNDLIIKRKALEICQYLVNEDNITEVVKILLLQLIPNENSVAESLKQEVTLKILLIASQDNYSSIPNFKWYVAVLKDIINLTLLPINDSASTAATSHSTADIIAQEIGKEFKNLATRVPSIRLFILHRVVIDSIQDSRIIELCPSLLKDFYWIMGEYNSGLDAEVGSDSEDEEEQNNSSVVSLGKKVQIFNSIVNNRIDKKLNLSTNLNFPISQKLIKLSNSDVLAVLVQALIKLFNGIVADYITIYSSNGKLQAEKVLQISYYLYKLIKFLNNWENHSNYEVQERSLSWLEFLKVLLEALTDNDLKGVEKMEQEEVEYYKTKSKELVEKSEEEKQSEEESESESESESDEDEYDDLESSDKEEIPVEENPFASDGKEVDLSDEKEEILLPVLLTHILPSFFTCYQLNPIAKNAQRKIGIPEDLDLETQINSLPFELISDDDAGNSDYELYFSETEDNTKEEESKPLTSSDELKKKQERLERLKDDPYYIKSDKKKSKSKKPLLRDEDNSSPESEMASVHSTNPEVKKPKSTKVKKLKMERVVILSDETIEGADIEDEIIAAKVPKRRNILQIDSSNLDNFDLNSSTVSDQASATADKDFEYNIDLDELRKKLAESSVQGETKKKKKKSKSKSGDKESKRKKENGTEEQTKTEKRKLKTQGADLDKIIPTNNETSELPEHTVITVLKPKKKKKSKAVIID
jgi:AP-3 complex subunit delta-1